MTGIREAYRRAGKNATGLIEAMDLEQLFGGDVEVEGNEETFHEAQQQLVRFLRRKFGDVADSCPAAAKEEK